MAVSSRAGCWHGSQGRQTNSNAFFSPSDHLFNPRSPGCSHCSLVLLLFQLRIQCQEAPWLTHCHLLTFPGEKKTRIGPRADFFTAGFSLVSPGVLLTKITNFSFVKWPELKTQHTSTWKEWKREFWMAQHSVACSSSCILGLPTGAAGIYTPSKAAPGPFLFAQTSVDASWHQGDAAVVQEHPVKLAVPRYL